MVFLQGDLHISIIEARGLPNVDGLGFGLTKNLSDPYVSTYISTNGSDRSQNIAKTRVIDDNLDPKWNETFKVPICHNIECIHFDIKDSDFLKSQFLGTTNVAGEDLFYTREVKGWFSLNPAKGSIKLALKFVPLGSTSGTRSLIPREVSGAYFRLRTDCRVKLYQDAHTPAVSPVTEVPTASGDPYEPPSLWVDITKAIEGAEKLIYIAGWAVKANMSLIRSEEENEHLGELLKRKASEGVKVLVMVWNEALSSDFYSPGLMGTHDEETRVYFRGTDVRVALTPRQSKGGKIADQMFVNANYTHHQKCVIVDAAPVEGKASRRLVAFLGGIDLTDGRYDTPEHPLFATLPTTHKDDYYNGICLSTVDKGPREPWHDVHMYIEGSAAFDVHANFEERWKCQATGQEGHLVSIFDLTDHVEEKDSPLWSAQFFRSINSDSANFHPDKIGKLPSKKGRRYEDSIQQAYVHNIRRARKFVYIEQQYFLGSSHSWEEPNPKCPHLIPMELTARIISAIQEDQEFRVYIVIPIHPEGDPTSAAVQEILHWQNRTMSMMYKNIAAAISEKGSDAHPTDYLSFFFLGKRESPEDVPDSLGQPARNTVAYRARESLRFMIYVHCKMAIFDDDYIIVGSANINERSMSGNRDTEMAMGCYQPEVSNSEEGMDHGDIKTFRLALWAEHCGAHMEEHLNPQSLECMTYMKTLGRESLHRFLAPEPERIESHLMSYPIVVYKDGKVHARNDCETFPDTGGKVVGCPSNMLPNALTT